MVNVATAWWWLSCIVLLFEAYRDWKTLKVDEREVYLLFGYTLFLGIYMGTNILEIFGFMIAAAIVLLTSRSVLARGDQMILFALMFGHYKLGTLLWFMLCFIAALGAYVIGRKIKKSTRKAPALPLITAAHLLTLPLFF